MVASLIFQVCHFSHRLYDYKKWLLERRIYITDSTGTVRTEGHWLTKTAFLVEFWKKVIGSSWTLTQCSMCCFLTPIIWWPPLNSLCSSKCWLSHNCKEAPQKTELLKGKLMTEEQQNEATNGHLNCHPNYHFNWDIIYTTLTKSNMWTFSQVSFKLFASETVAPACLPRKRH